jgi:NSS family neurotransmitter:Na+ symporter
MAGLAIGLGNVWRFPYMMGQHGGSAFLLVYVIFMLLLAVPALSSEWSLGRSTRSGPVVAFQTAFGPRTGLVIGLVLLFAVFMATTYYSIVVANVVFSAWFAASSGFNPDSLAQYQAGLGRHGIQYGIALGVILSCLWVVHRGLRRGIETANKLLVPLFGVAALYLVVVTLSLDGAIEKLVEFIKPDFSLAGPSVWFAAMGQACFSVGLSGTMAVMYGSYLRDEARIGSTSAITCLMDLGAAFLAALFVVPAVLVFGLDLAAGPSLLFNTLPKLFAVMPGGRWLAPVFLSGWALVSLLSIIASIDTIAGALSDLTGRKFKRRQWLWTVGLLSAVVMLPIALNPEWIGVLDLVFGSGFFMLGALLAVLAIGWGLGKAKLKEQVSQGLSPGLAKWMAWWIRYVVPMALTAILIGFLYSTVSA